VIDSQCNGYRSLRINSLSRCASLSACTSNGALPFSYPQFGVSGPGSGPLCVIKSNSAAETHPRIAGSIALFVESPAKAMENRDRVALWVCKPFPPGRSGSRSLTTATDSRSLSGATGATALKGGLLE